jgi:hypothetical protein
MQTLPIPRLEANYAISMQPNEAAAFEVDNQRLDEFWTWTAWKRRHWPADIIHPGLQLYGFDLRKNRRELFVLLKVTHGGAFRFESMDNFVEQVQELTEGWTPDKEADPNSNDKWQDIEERLQQAGTCTGICVRWRVLKKVSIPLRGRFPMLGWGFVAEMVTETSCRYS